LDDAFAAAEPTLPRSTRASGAARISHHESHAALLADAPASSFGVTGAAEVAVPLGEDPSTLRVARLTLPFGGEERSTADNAGFFDGLGSRRRGAPRVAAFRPIQGT
jgi:hypothetical protein